MKNLLANFMYLFGTLVQFFVYGSILGCALAYVILYAITEGYLIRWEPVPSPPGKAVKILASDCYRAFVQTASGEKYECKASSWQCLALLDVPEEIQTRSMADFPHSYRPPLKLDGAIQMTEYFEDHFEYNCYAYFALTGDGKLFRWGYGVSGLEGFAIASFLILGSGLFFMFFAGLYVTLKLLSGKQVKKTAYRRSSPPL